MAEYVYCPVCIKNKQRYPLALMVEGVEMKRKLFRRNTYAVIESYKPCPICDSILKQHTTMEVHNG